MEIVGAVFVLEVSDDGNGLLLLLLGKIHNNLGMENLLFCVLVKVIRGYTHKHALCIVSGFLILLAIVLLFYLCLRSY